MKLHATTIKAVLPGAALIFRLLVAFQRGLVSPAPRAQPTFAVFWLERSDESQRTK